MNKWILAGLFASLFWGPLAVGQRTYKAHSILSSGAFFKLGVTGPGVYKIDATVLKKLGVTGTNIPSSAFRLFGNGGAMLPEANAIPRIDDLQENAIQVVDGGTGVFANGDYILFYAPGPHPWTADSTVQRFHHHKNLYSDTAYYFLTVSDIGGTPLRVTSQTTTPNPTVQVNTYQDHEYHELDSLNFLSSGKYWYGEEMADIPGSSTSLGFVNSVPGLVSGGKMWVTTDVVARSIGVTGVVTVSLDDSLIQTHNVQPTGSGAYDLFAYEDSISSPLTLFNADSAHLEFNFSSSALNAQAWLAWWELMLPRSLNFEGSGQFTFRDWASIGPRQMANFVIGGATTGATVWEVTNPQMPMQLKSSLSSGQLSFVNDASRLREYVAFQLTGISAPAALGPVITQDLHASPVSDLVVVAYPSLLTQAQRLADFHKVHDSLRVLVATTSQIFNEFASGSPDPTSIRDFIKMFYDKAGADTSKRPKYLLLFGDASYDYKHRIPANDNLVPCYESPVSLDPLNTYTSDDYFGFLKDQDDINSSVQLNLLDVGVGRIPATGPADAKSIVDKIIGYNSLQSYGPWRTEMTFVADDGDQNLHLQDAEAISVVAAQEAPQNHINKIYLDAYPEQATSAGGRYPEVVTAISNEMYSGTLLLNYNGHGGNTRLSNEDIMDASTIATWSNATHLPLLITATCNFAAYDDPEVQSLGEKVILQTQTGAVALMTTTRDVFAFSNLVINTNYMEAALANISTGVKPPSLGQAMMTCKNNTYATFSDIVNNRKFTLIGDPALTLAYPKTKMTGLTVNGIALKSDTLKALNRYTLTANVNSPSGLVQSTFNGTAYVTVYDKPSGTQTRGNNAGSLVTTFMQQNSVIYSGKSTVSAGKFQVTFVVPKDIDYTLGKGKMTYYADNGVMDASGSDSIWVGGTGTNALNDHTGPTIKAYLNSTQFVNGSITNQTPVLLLNLFDSSGINTTGTTVGHDLTAVLDQNTSSPFILNKFYQAVTNSYQSGTVSYPLPAMTPGLHSLLIKAWDVFDNPSEFTLNFIVEGDGKLVLDHVLNYPNPFTTHTQFWFEHNKPGEPLQVMIRVMTITGKIIKTIRKTIIDPGNRSTDLEWDGRDDFGNKLGKGVYLFELQVRTSDGQAASAMNKMVLL
jgi:hypothetical protein